MDLLAFFLGFKPKQSRKEKANGQLFLVHCFFARIVVEQTRNQTTEEVSPFVAKRYVSLQLIVPMAF